MERDGQQAQGAGGVVEDGLQLRRVVGIFGQLPGCGFVDVFVAEADSSPIACRLSRKVTR
jgi:hypothetical protein